MDNLRLFKTDALLAGAHLAPLLTSTIRLSKRLVPLLLAAILLLPGAPVRAATGRRLLTAMAVDDFVLTSDGRYVVFIHGYQATNGESFDIFSLDLSRVGRPRSLNGNSEVNGYWNITPDRETVLFHTDGDSNGYRLFSVPVRGGAVTPLGFPFPQGTGLSLYGFSRDSRYVLFAVYSVAGQKSTYDGFYSQPVTGGDPVLLLPADGDLREFDTSPDGSHIVYLAEEEGSPLNIGTESDHRSLYSIPLTGGASVPLHVAKNLFASVVSFLITPDSTTVLYATDERVDGLYELYSVPIGGGEPILLSDNRVLAYNDGNFSGRFTVSDDSRTAIFHARRTIDDPKELYWVPITGGSPTGIAPDSVSQTLVQDRYRLEGQPITTRGNLVFYSALEGDSEEREDLFWVEIGTGKSLQLNVLNTDEFLSIADSEYSVSPDGRSVVFRAGTIPDPTFLYIVSTTTGKPAKLADGYWANFKYPFSPDGKYVFFADELPDCTGEPCTALYRAPVTGGSPTLVYLSDPVAFDYEPVPDTNEVVFLHDQSLYVTAEGTETLYLPALAQAAK